MGTRVPAGAFFTEAEVVVAAKLLRQEQRRAAEAGATLPAAARSMLATCDELIEAQVYRAAEQVAKLAQVHPRHALDATCDMPGKSEHDDLTTAQAARTLHPASGSSGASRSVRASNRVAVRPVGRRGGHRLTWQPWSPTAALSSGAA